MTIIQLLARLRATVSMAQGRRFVSQNCVKLNGLPISDDTVDFVFHPGDIVTVGKTEFKVTENHLAEETTT